MKKNIIMYLLVLACSIQAMDKFGYKDRTRPELSQDAENQRRKLMDILNWYYESQRCPTTISDSAQDKLNRAVNSLANRLSTEKNGSVSLMPADEEFITTLYQIFRPHSSD